MQNNVAKVTFKENRDEVNTFRVLRLYKAPALQTQRSGVDVTKTFWLEVKYRWIVNSKVAYCPILKALEMECLKMNLIN